MRLWSIHPQYLDRAGLIALWREGLLAKKVLEGGTKGYKNHPQLVRFKLTADPVAAINNYLHAVANEAHKRGYNFNKAKLAGLTELGWEILITDRQLAYEKTHLMNKLAVRDTILFGKLKLVKEIIPHPIFTVIPGPVASWEKQ